MSTMLQSNAFINSQKILKQRRNTVESLVGFACVSLKVIVWKAIDDVTVGIPTRTQSSLSLCLRCARLCWYICTDFHISHTTTATAPPCCLLPSSLSHSLSLLPKPGTMTALFPTFKSLPLQKCCVNRTAIPRKAPEKGANWKEEMSYYQDL